MREKVRSLSPSLINQKGSRTSLSQLHVPIGSHTLKSNKRVLIGRIISKAGARAHLLKLTCQHRAIIKSGTKLGQERSNQTPSSYISSLTNQFDAMHAGLFFIDCTGCIPCVLESPHEAILAQNLAITEYTIVRAQNTTTTYHYLEIKRMYLFDAILSRCIHIHEGFDWANLMNYAVEPSYPSLSTVTRSDTGIGAFAGDIDAVSLTGTVASKTLIRVINDTSLFSIKITSTRILPTPQQSAMGLNALNNAPILTAFIEYRDVTAEHKDEIYALHQRIRVGCSYVFEGLKPCMLKIQEKENEETQKSFRFVFGRSTFTRLDSGTPQPSQCINAATGELSSVSTIVDVEVTIISILNSDIGVFTVSTEDTESRLYLCASQASLDHLGLRIGARICIRNVHRATPAFKHSLELNIPSFIACENSTIDVIGFSDADTCTELSRLKQRCEYFESWRHVNQADLVLMDHLRALFDSRSIVFESDTILNLMRVFGYREYVEKLNLFNSHDSSCALAEMKYVVPEMPSLHRLIQLVESVEVRMTGIPMHHLSSLLNAPTCLIGMLTCDMYGNSYISNDDIRCMLVLFDLTHDDPSLKLEYGQAYCILDCMACTESFLCPLSNESFTRHYIALKKSQLISLSNPDEISTEVAKKKIKLAVMHGFLFKITQIGSTHIDKHGQASLNIHATLFDIIFTKQHSYSINSMQSGVKSYIKITGKHIASMLTSSINDTFLMQAYHESMDTNDPKTPNLIQKLISIKDECWIKFVDVVMEVDQSESSMYLESLQAVNAFNEEYRSSIAIQTIDEVFEKLSRSNQSPVTVSVEGIIRFKEYAQNKGKRQDYTEADWNLFKDHNVGSGNQENSVYLTIASSDASLLKIFINLQSSLYPLGLLINSHIQITHLSIQKSYNSSSVYGTTTPESRISIVSLNNPEPTNRVYSTAHEHISAVGRSISAKETPSIVTIEYIKELKLFLVCSKCKSKVPTQHCDKCVQSILPLHTFQSQAFEPEVHQAFEVGGKVTLHVYDGTGSIYLNLYKFSDISAALKMGPQILVEIEKYILRNSEFVFVKEWVDWEDVDGSTGHTKNGFEAMMETCVEHESIRRRIEVLIKPRQEKCKSLVTGFGIPIESLWLDEKAMTAKRKKQYHDGSAVSEINYRNEARKLLDRLSLI